MEDKRNNNHSTDGVQEDKMSAKQRTDYSDFDFRLEIPLFLAIVTILFWGDYAIRIVPILVLIPVLVSASALLLLANVSPTKLQRLLPDGAIRVIILLAAPSSDALRVLQRRWQNYVRRRTPSFRKLRTRLQSRQYLGPVSTVDHLQILEANGEYERLIQHLRHMLRKDDALWTHPWVKDWIGRRWRNFFIKEATADQVAVEIATRKSAFSFLGFIDARTNAQKVAERFLKGTGPLEYPYVDGNETTFIMPDYIPPSDNLDVGILFCPGLLNGLIKLRAYQDAMTMAEKRFGVKILRSDSHPLKGCADNVHDIMHSIRTGKGFLSSCEATAGSGKSPFQKFVAMGYSKGAPDILHAYVEQQEFRERCVGVISVAGPIGGSYIANHLWDALKPYDAEWWVKNIDIILSKIAPAMFLPSLRPRRFEETKIRDAMYDLTTYRRDDFLTTHRRELDRMKIPVMCFNGSCTPSEVPFFQVQGALLLNVYDNNNDMQVTEHQAILHSPTSVHVARMHANHWDMAMPPFPLSMTLGAKQMDHPLPKKAFFAATVMLLAELGVLCEELKAEELLEYERTEPTEFPGASAIAKQQLRATADPQDRITRNTTSQQPGEAASGSSSIEH